MRRGVVIAALAFGTVTLRVPSAVADEHVPDEPRIGFPKRLYLGAGGGVSFLEPRSSTDALMVWDDTDTAAHLFAGIDLSRWLSVEGYVAHLDDARIGFLGDDIGRVDYTVYGASLIGYAYNSRSGFAIGNRQSGLFRREGLSLFGRVGIGGMTNDSDLDYERDYTAHLAVGGGIEYGFGNGFALRGEYTSYDEDAQYAAISILKRFGDVPIAPVALPAPEPELPEPERLAPLPSAPAPTLFAFDRSDLDADARSRLDGFVASLERARDLRIALGGHTDAIGTEEYNLGLSARRANAVRRYLVGQGIDPASIAVESFGETRPVAPNDTPDGRALNRRVEITLSR